MEVLNVSYPIKTNKTWEIIDSTKVKAYQECPRRFFYEYVLGWRSERPNNHLVFGSAVHEMLEHLALNGYGAESIQEGYTKFLSCYRASFPPETDAIFSPKTPARFLDAIVLYCQKYKTDFDKCDVYKTEIGGTVPVGRHSMHFKCDTIMYDRSIKKYFSREHKTFGGYVRDSWIEDFKLNTQVGTYCHVLYCFFDKSEVFGVEINGLGFKKTKTPGYDFIRVPIPKTPAQMQIWYSNMVMWLDSIEQDYEILSQSHKDGKTLDCFKMNPGSCMDWGRTCQYHDFCMSWSNPLTRSDVPPIGLVVNYWDPSEIKVTEKVSL